MANYLTVERSIRIFSSDWIYTNTRFHSPYDLLRLQIPDKIILPNRRVLSGEEALTLYSLRLDKLAAFCNSCFSRRIFEN